MPGIEHYRFGDTMYSLNNKAILLPHQITILQLFFSASFASSFFLTGGTCLSAFYLAHRLNLFNVSGYDNFVIFRSIDKIFFRCYSKYTLKNMKLKLKNFSTLHLVSLAVLGIFLIGFPLILTNQTTDIFSVPKQTLLAFASLLGILLIGLKSIQDGTVRIRRTFFDVPVLLFTLFVAVSAFFSPNRIDSIISLFPFLFSVLLFFAIVNHLRTKFDAIFSILVLLSASSVVSVIITFSYFKIYILPLSYTKTQFFSPFGSLIDQALFLVITLALGIFFFPMLFPDGIRKTNIKNLQKQIKDPQFLLLAITTLLTLIGTSVTLYALAFPQKALILPFSTGFQTAFASISQDSQRLFQGFLFGSGFGTFASVFTKFKQAQFNLNPNMWSLTFYRSSSFVLELLATTGVLGLVSFLYIAVKVIKTTHPLGYFTGGNYSKNPYSLSLLLLLAASLVLPFSPTIITLFFVILGLFAVSEAAIGTNPQSIFDIEIYFVALKRGMFAIENVDSKPQERGKFLPAVFFLLLAGVSLALGYYTYLYVASDVLFQKSVVAASKNLGSQTYDYQNSAIKLFPYRDGYYRVFSQTNIAVAAFIANQQKGSSDNTQTQATIYRLIQQAIESAKTATSLSPKTSQNWENLSSIYRSLIGFGQSAENFAILASQQAQALDSNNPQQYIYLGGVYYQLGQWDNAQRQFQIAISLKPDLPNGYYNLGHALESKGDLEEALTQYKTVKTLVASDTANSSKIQVEIDSVEKKIQTGKTQAEEAKKAAEKPTDKLGINKPTTQLPEKKPPIALPALTSTKSATNK